MIQSGGKVINSKRKKTTQVIQDPISQFLKNLKKGFSFSCCELDRAYDLTVTEVIRKNRSHCPNNTSCCLTLDSRCCVAVNGVVGRIQINVTCERIDLIPYIVPLPTMMNPTSTPLIREELILQISEIGPYAIKYVG